MARPIARDAEDFARLMLQALERRGPEAGWLSARALFEQTAARHPGHPWLAHLVAKPARRSALNATLERLREAEFPDLERRKDGDQRNAAVLYRRRKAPPAPDLTAPVRLDLQLPYEAPASHPLLNERRAAEARGAQATSARRSALTDSVPLSPWRRRLLPRPLALPPGGLEQAWSSVRHCWHRLRATVSELASGVVGH